MTTYRRDGNGYPQMTDCLSTSSDRQRHQARVTAIQLGSRNRSRHRRGCPERAESSSSPITTPRLRANREDCEVVVVVWVVPLATDARTGSCGGRGGFVTFAFKLELGPLTRVRRGESGLGGIGACALSGIGLSTVERSHWHQSHPLSPSPRQTR